MQNDTRKGLSTIFFSWYCTGAVSCSASSELLLNLYSSDEDELLRHHELLSLWIRSQRTHYWTDSPLWSGSVDFWWGLVFGLCQCSCSQCYNCYSSHKSSCDKFRSILISSSRSPQHYLHQLMLCAKQIWLCHYSVWVAVLNRGAVGVGVSVAMNGDQYSSRWTTWGDSIMFPTVCRPRSSWIKWWHKKRSVEWRCYWFISRLKALVVDLQCISGRMMSNPGMETGFVNISN
jgi:hypothetical protein